MFPRLLRHSCFCLAALCWLAFFPVAAGAAESIRAYHVLARLQEDASLLVTERIEVNIERRKIVRGITRAYPVKRRLEDGSLVHYGFTMLSAKLDGTDVPFHLAQGAWHAGVAVGSADKYAPLGVHTYELTYRTDNHIRFLADHAELYYNAIGFENVFPVGLASFRLELPGGAAPTHVTAYTGSRGETGRDFRMEGDSLVSTRPFKPGEGMTVVMAFDKKIVPPPAQSWANWLGSHRTLALGGILALTLLYFLLVRLGLRALSGEGRQTVIPLFSPPQGMSPGLMASLKNRAWTPLMLQSDIMWLAVNGYLRMRLPNKKTVVLHPETGEKPPRQDWVRSQCGNLFQRLFSGTASPLNLNEADSREYLGDVYRYQTRAYDKGLWKKNTWAGVVGGILFMVLTLLLMPYISTPMLDWSDGDVLSYMGILSTLLGLAGVCFWGLRNALYVFKGVRRVLVFCCVPLLLLGIVGTLWGTTEPVDCIFVVFYAGGLALVWVLGTRFMRSRTAKGVQRYTPVQGLEMYVRTAEKERLAMINAPEDTVEKYEEILPYAVALGCAQAWQKRFAPLLASVDYEPQWCETPPELSPMFYTTVLARASGNALSSAASATAAAAAAASAAAALRSSGGSSGGSGGGSGFSGGSAGGGSGGGGVGGW